MVQALSSVPVYFIRKQRKALLPAFLIIGLSKRHVQNIDKGRSLFFYQLQLLKMAFTGKL